MQLHWERVRSFSHVCPTDMLTARSAHQHYHHRGPDQRFERVVVEGIVERAAVAAWAPTLHGFAMQSQSPQSLAWCGAHQTIPHSGPLRRLWYGATPPRRCARAVLLLSGRPEDAHSCSSRRPWCAVLMQSRAGACCGSCCDIENGERLPQQCSSFARTRAAPATRRARF